METVAALRLALPACQRPYHEPWRIGRHGYKAPAQVRRAQQASWLMPHHFRPKGVQKTVDRYTMRSAV